MNNDFNDLYDDCTKICETNSISNPDKTRSIRRTKASTTSNLKDTYMNYHDTIIDIFVKEIQERFNADNLEPVLELFHVIMIEDEQTLINFNKLKMYDKLINLVDLKLELQSYVKYKLLNHHIMWKEFDILLEEFNKKDLKQPFQQIYSVIKLYLTIPITTSEGARCFSALKLIKSCLRTTMTNDRLSNLAILKIANDVKINYDDIINAFASVKNRQMSFF